MKKFILKLWNNHRENKEKQQRNEEISSFNITERNNNIYIMAGLRAIKIIDQETTAKEIIELLNCCRNAQISYIKKNNNG